MRPKSPPSPAMTRLETDATRPSIPLITITSPFSGALLDKHKGNWETWKNSMYSVTCLSGLYSYMTGTATAPDKEIEPHAHANWMQNDERACAFIFGAIEEGERTAVGPHLTDAKKFWDSLATRHEKDGPVSQVYLIKEVMGKHAVVGEPLTKNLDELFRTLDRAWKMGTITIDLLKSIMALNFFSSKTFQDIQFGIQDRIKASTKENPFTSTDIREFVKEREHLMAANNHAATNESNSVALSARGPEKKRSDNICTNCKRPRHTVQYCVAQNGGMAGKTIKESKAQRTKDRNAKNPNAKSTTTLGTTTTQAMVTRSMKDETTGAVYLVCMPTDAMPTSVQPQALMSVSATQTPTSDIDTMVFSTDDLEVNNTV
ncbi:hypothetical protein NLJ89_g10709 [Agrocybe chaxingu]|uniref:Retrotransposon Copia-like N-terminal domain-containing protein n=1 Tax=Agrocybe chaxingu TaxID=84603 RepID=A0A9W8JRA3_9AGAR|nr:hypothetical protein NLJ89_g10709 [Agrocybe chaxingu]